MEKWKVPAPAPTDLIDRVDDQNRPVGLVQRAEALVDGSNFRTVHVLLLEDSGHLLLQRIPSSRRRFPGRLGSSVAGYLLRGETFEAAAARRTYEELGVRPHLDRLGTTHMIDEHSKKFVGVFRGDGEGATIQDRHHVAELLRVLPSEIQGLLSQEPGRFTPTFVEVWRFAQPHLS